MGDSFPPTQFGADDVKLLEKEPLYRGFFRMDRVLFKHRLFAGGWSAPVSRELLCRGAAVGVLLYDKDHDLVGLVEQIRVGALSESGGPWCLEVVAGVVEAGEAFEEVAHRELKEESGLVVESLEYLCHYYPSPGGCDESMYLYCASVDLSQVSERLHGLEDEHEDIRFHVFPRQQVMEDLYQGRFNNAATLIAMQWLQLKLAGHHSRLPPKP